MWRVREIKACGNHPELESLGFHENAQLLWQGLHLWSSTDAVPPLATSTC